MNKETELYLIKRIEELAGELAYAHAHSEQLEREIETHLKPDAEMLSKATLYTVISRFITVRHNSVNNETKIVFTAPEIDVNKEMADLFLKVGVGYGE